MKLTRLQTLLLVVFNWSKFQAIMFEAFESTYERGKFEQKRESEKWQKMESEMRQKLEMKRAIEAIKF